MNKKLITLIVVLAIVFCASYLVKNAPEINIKKVDLGKVPYTIGGWKGTDEEVEIIRDTEKRIQATQIIYRIYKKEAKLPVALYISYCKSLKDSPNFKYHFPKYCYVGSGWDIIQETKEKIAGGMEGGGFPAHKLIMVKGEEKMVSIFYLQTRRDIKLTLGIGQRVTELINRLFFRRSDIAMVRLSTYVFDNNFEESFKVLEEFIKHLDPVVTKLLTDVG